MISIDPAKMKVATQLNGTVINGYTGYYETITEGEDEFFIIAIPLNEIKVRLIMTAIDSRE